MRQVAARIIGTGVVMTTATHSQNASPSNPNLTGWEMGADRMFIWVPYVTLAVSVLITQLEATDASDRRWSVGLAIVAATWTWLTFTRHGSPVGLDQKTVRIYFVGFLLIATVAVFEQPMFLFYGITGLLHAALLRPWAVAFAGIGASALIVYSTVVYPNSTLTNWIIYIAVVLVQTVAIGVGLYAGDKVMLTAEERGMNVERLEAAMAENVGLHEQLVVQAREAGILDERQRIAREIHDTIAQGLTGIITQIEAVRHSWGDDDEMRRHLDNASGLARESLTEARRSVQAIRPTPLDNDRLPEALAQVTTRWSEVTGVELSFSTNGTLQRLRPEIEVTVLRVTQEALANVEKHANASRVGVTLSFMEDAVVLDVRDDGAGFDPDAGTKSDGYGLSSIRQRVENVHGELFTESSPGDGTAISVRIPTDLIGSSNA